MISVSTRSAAGISSRNPSTVTTPASQRGRSAAGPAGAWPCPSPMLPAPTSASTVVLMLVPNVSLHGNNAPPDYRFKARHLGPETTHDRPDLARAEGAH